MVVAAVVHPVERVVAVHFIRTIDAMSVEDAATMRETVPVLDEVEDVRDHAAAVRALALESSVPVLGATAVAAAVIETVSVTVGLGRNHRSDQPMIALLVGSRASLPDVLFQKDTREAVLVHNVLPPGPAPDHIAVMEILITFKQMCP